MMGGTDVYKNYYLSVGEKIIKLVVNNNGRPSREKKFNIDEH